jgi:LysM repeat protein
MKKNVFYSLVIIAVFSVLLASCYLPASKTPAKPPQLLSGTPGAPTATSPIKDIISGTATAIARAASPTVVIVQPTGKVVPTNAAVATKPASVQPTTVVINPQPTTAVINPQTTTVPTTVVIPPLTRPSTYTLQKGEWPICIARRYDLNMGSLLSINGLSLDSRPGVGTVLQIPKTGSWDSGARALKSHPGKYTVKSGDTANSIACDYGDVDPEAILAVNGLSSSSSLSAGQTINIP